MSCLLRSSRHSLLVSMSRTQVPVPLFVAPSRVLSHASSWNLPCPKTVFSFYPLRKMSFWTMVPLPPLSFQPFLMLSMQTSGIRLPNPVTVLASKITRVLILLLPFFISIIVFGCIQWYENSHGGEPLFTFPGLEPYEKDLTDHDAEDAKVDDINKTKQVHEQNSSEEEVQAEAEEVEADSEAEA
mmetsp:Transcript_46817/g.69614  ORF Transcript_46817/g.69614 Transcript_46817/m.69614 type:complete len:185 (-) Transcript_46817:93-647(-)